MERNSYCLGGPLTVVTDPILLLDDTYVEDRWGVQRRLNIPRKCPSNPLLVPDQPWEDGIGQPSVLYDAEAGLFRMWYTVVDRDAHKHQFKLKDWSFEKHGFPYFPAYAESQDGINWSKPLFDDKPYRHFPKTNVVMSGIQKVQACRVTWNHPSTGQPGRFMMTYKDNLSEEWGVLCLAYSDDGVHWRNDPTNPAMTGLRDTWHNMIFDEKRDRWLLFTRPICFAGVPDYPGGPDEHNFKRRVAVAVGDTPQSFGQPRVVMWPDECDQPDFDHMIVVRQGHHFLGFLGQMGPPPEQAFWQHLAFSEDGLHWQQLPDRPPLIDHGGPHEFDRGSTSSVGGVVTVGDMSYLYYRGGTRGQGGGENRQFGIGRVELERDRFVVQMGQNDGGFLLTREIIVPAGELVVNMTLAGESSGSSNLRPPEFAAEVLAFQEDGGPPKPVAGFTCAECVTEPRDSIEHVVAWKEKKNLNELIGRPVFVRFFLRNVGLYSIRFRESPE